MFGLMKPEKACSNKQTDDYRYHRMHYCGTCKTLGQKYGHKTRMMLNFDTVFLSEILSHLSNENLQEWKESYQAINKCFTMPDKSEKSPLSLEYAAATNIVLGELKIDDNIKDGRSLPWKFARLLLSKSFRKANQQFKNWGLDTDHLWYWIKKQDELEKGNLPTNYSLTQLLEYYAEPTAQITASIFEHGAVMVGKQGFQDKMRQIGYHFGQLVYILDAFEDIEKDIFNHQFNPLTHFYNISETVSNAQLTEVRQLIIAYQTQAAKQLAELPFSEETIEKYQVRLYSNVTTIIYKNRKTPKSINDTIQATIIGTIQSTKQAILNNLSSLRNTNYYLVSMVLFVIPIAVDILSFNHNETEIYKWGLIFTAILGGFGLMKHVFTKEKRQKTKLLIKNIFSGKQKLSFALILGFFAGKNACADACLEVCLSICCDVCCEICCEECADSC